MLATLDRGSAQSTFDAAAASLHQAEDAYARMKQLYDKKSLPEMQMVEVETRLQQARSMYELSKKNINDCALHAPFAGGIGALIAVVTVLPVLYWKLYGKEEQKRQTRGAVAPPETHTA